MIHTATITTATLTSINTTPMILKTNPMSLPAPMTPTTPMTPITLTITPTHLVIKFIRHFCFQIQTTLQRLNLQQINQLPPILLLTLLKIVRLRKYRSLSVCSCLL